MSTPDYEAMHQRAESAVRAVNADRASRGRGVDEATIQRASSILMDLWAVADAHQVPPTSWPYQSLARTALDMAAGTRKT